MASMAATSCAGTVTFGTGSNQFQMEFVTIGDPGNAADFTGSPSPAGSVGYTYGIGKFEVSEDMITKFNASQTLQITTRYTLGPAKAASGISWNEAARFVNWLNTSTGNQAAYKFATSGVNDDSASWTSGEAGYDVNNPYRNRLAMYVLPSYNEWYKAAYYDPNKSGGAGYWDYATGSDSAPAAVSSGTGTGANGNNEAVYGSQASFPADVNQAGGLSPYGVMGLNGNVTEWHEDSVSLTHGVSSSHRGLRGGSWFYRATDLNIREFSVPTNKGNSYGFRVARLSSSAVVPEPTSMVIFGLGALGMAYRARRKRRCKA